MTGKGNPERVVFGAAALAMCWLFPNPVVGGLALSVLIGLFYSARPETAPAIEAEGRGKILAKIAGVALLDALAAYGCAWGIPLLPPLLKIPAAFVAAFVFAVVPFVVVGCLVIELFTEDRRPARRSKLAESRR